MNRNTTPIKTVLTGSALAFFLTAATGYAGSGTDYSGEARDAWLDGKVETAFALNEHLNPFVIDTDVENGIVVLTGTVESDIDRDLAGQIAMSVEGVQKVKNELEVAASEQSDIERTANDWFQKVSDATTTAIVKSKLLANGNTKGLQINVDTRDNVVTLRGTVESSEVKDLAEALAQNTENVNRVENKLEIMEKSKS